MTSRRIPVACNLERAEFGERWKQWQALIGHALIEKHHTEDGLRLVFAHSVEAELKRLASAEGECCGFAEWLVTRARAGQFVLEVKADGIGAEAVRSMFE